MTDEQREPDQEVFEDRRGTFVASLVTLVRTGYLNEKSEVSVNNYNFVEDSTVEAIKSLVDDGALPEFVVRDDHQLGIDGYALKIFLGNGRKIVSEGFDAERSLEELRSYEEAAMPGGLPSDGSKGQWRVANRHNQRSYRWFLGWEDE